MLMMYRTPENMANVMAPLSSVMPVWLVPRMVAPHAVPKRLANHSKGLVAATPWVVMVTPGMGRPYFASRTRNVMKVLAYALPAPVVVPLEAPVTQSNVIMSLLLR